MPFTFRALVVIAAAAGSLESAPTETYDYDEVEKSDQYDIEDEQLRGSLPRCSPVAWPDPLVNERTVAYSYIIKGERCYYAEEVDSADVCVGDTLCEGQTGFSDVRWMKHMILPLADAMRDVGNIQTALEQWRSVTELPFWITYECGPVEDILAGAAAYPSGSSAKSDFEKVAWKIQQELRQCVAAPAPSDEAAEGLFVSQAAETGEQSGLSRAISVIAEDQLSKHDEASKELDEHLDSGDEGLAYDGFSRLKLLFLKRLVVLRREYLEWAAALKLVQSARRGGACHAAAAQLVSDPNFISGALKHPRGSARQFVHRLASFCDGSEQLEAMLSLGGTEDR